MNRRKFIKVAGSLLILTACGDSAAEEILKDKKVKIRFATASDLHYGEPNTDWEEYLKSFSDGFKEFNKNNPCEFLVINGDIIHNDPKFLPMVAPKLKAVHPKLYVTQGNHDRVTNEVWKEAWGIEFNHDFTSNGQAFLFAETSDLSGSQLCPPLNWLEEKFEKYKSVENIFLFMHIYPYYPQVGCTEFETLVSKYSNVRAIFNGHDHNNEGFLYTEKKIPFMFNGRIGGSWGTFDKEFRVVELMDDNSLVTYLMTPWNKKKLTTF